MIVLKGNDAFPMSSEYTKMKPADYKFLERFLDATKANLFFARGLIMVEEARDKLKFANKGICHDRKINRHNKKHEIKLFRLVWAS